MSNPSSDLPEWIGLLLFALSEEREGFHLPQHFKNQVGNKKTELKEELYNRFSSIATDVRALYFSQETDWSIPTRHLFLMIFYSFIKEVLQKSCSIHTVAVASDDELGDVAAAVDEALYNLRLKKENDPKALFHVCIQALTPALLHRGSAISEKRFNFLLGVLEKISALNQEQIDGIRDYQVYEHYQFEDQKIPHEREIDLSKTIESFQFIDSDHSEFDPTICRLIDWSKIQDPRMFYEAIKKVPPIHAYDFIFDCTDEVHASHDGRLCAACANFTQNLETTKLSIAQKICATLHRKLTCINGWGIDFHRESVAIATASKFPRDLQVEIDFRPFFITPAGEKVEGLSLHAVIGPTDTIMKLDVVEKQQADSGNASDSLPDASDSQSTASIRNP